VSRLLLSGARIVCPYTSIDSTGDVLIEDGRVAAVCIGKSLDVDQAESVDCKGLVLSPAFVDVHVHLREPGEEHKETIASGASAALAGGFTTICAMPNTNPAIDNSRLVRWVVDRANGTGIRVLPIGAITIARQGKVPVDYEAMVKAGAVAFSDDGSPVMNSRMMRLALLYSRTLGVPISSHCEDTELSANGCMHDGAVSARLGLPGIPASAEEAMIYRDLSLAAETGGHIHIAHVSTSGGVEAIRHAKKIGVRVTAEATPHHFTFTDEWVAGWRDSSTDRCLSISAYDTNAKVNPPLRSREHVEAVIDGLVDGTIDAIATDHAPHSVLEKDCPFEEAAFGISGLETALPLSLELVRTGRISMMKMVSLLTISPAKAFGIDHWGIEEGRDANLVLFDPNLKWTVTPSALLSKGKNTPLIGRQVMGRVLMTISGNKRYVREELKAKWKQH